MSATMNVACQQCILAPVCIYIYIYICLFIEYCIVVEMSHCAVQLLPWFELQVKVVADMHTLKRVWFAASGRIEVRVYEEDLLAGHRTVLVLLL